jgi:hypothetical protein
LEINHMTPAAIAAILTLVEEAATAAPAIIADIETLIARLKAPPATPLAPEVTSDTAALAAELAKA